MRRLLIARDQRDTAYLIEALNDTDPLLRSITIRYLAKLQAVESIPAVLRLLQASNDNVRVAAVIALGDLRASAATDELIAIAEGDEKDFVRSWALGSLRKIDVDIGLTAARASWEDESWIVRRSVVKTFLNYGGWEEQSLIEEAMKSEKNWRRRAYYARIKRRMKTRIKKER
jgi:HEAT repeat protein